MGVYLDQCVKKLIGRGSRIRTRTDGFGDLLTKNTRDGVFLFGETMQIVVPIQKFERVKKALIGEIEYQDKVGDIKVYSLVLEELDQNVAAADLFMVSDLGGYTQGELNKIKRIMNYMKQNRKREVSNPVETF